MNRSIESPESRIEPIDYMALSVDTSIRVHATAVITDFERAGGSVVKLGLEAASAFGGPEGLSELATECGVDWIYDGKLKDIGNTMAKTIENISRYINPPVAITMHADTSFKAMQTAQETAGDILMLGVTLLTDISPAEAYKYHATAEERRMHFEEGYTAEEMGEFIRVRIVMERATKLGEAGVRGLVSSPKELDALNNDAITQGRFKLIPGTRSVGANAHDQGNTMTPELAIAKGADMLVIGRQYLDAEDPVAELDKLQAEIARGLASNQPVA